VGSAARHPVRLLEVPQAGVIGGNVYLPGGLHAVHQYIYASNSMAIYGVASDTWTTETMPQYMTSNAVWVKDGLLYVLGRCRDDDTYGGDGPAFRCEDAAAPYSFLLRYSPGTHSWAYLPTPFVDPGFDPVSGQIGGQVFVTAGGSSALNSYDPGTGSLRGWAPLDPERFYAAGDAVKAKLYVVGGRMRKPDGTIGDSRATSEFTPTTNSWVNRAQLPEILSNIRATRVNISGQVRLAVVGGHGRHYQWAP
jgi:hypothetical protein